MSAVGEAAALALDLIVHADAALVRTVTEAVATLFALLTSGTRLSGSTTTENW